MTDRIYVGLEFAPIFSHAKAEWYASGCAENPQSLAWEYRIKGQIAWIGSYTCEPTSGALEYRWKPKPKRMVTIGYRDGSGLIIERALVAPENVAPNLGEECFIKALLSIWVGSDNQQHALRKGHVFRSAADTAAMESWLSVCRKGGA